MHINTVHSTNSAKQDWTMYDLLCFFYHQRLFSLSFRSYCCYFIRLPDSFTFMAINVKREREFVVNGLIHIDLEHWSKFSCVWIYPYRIWRHNVYIVQPHSHKLFSNSSKFYSEKLRILNRSVLSDRKQKYTIHLNQIYWCAFHMYVWKFNLHSKKKNDTPPDFLMWQ